MIITENRVIGGSNQKPKEVDEFEIVEVVE